MHFAAYTIVPESVAEPLKYYGNNTCSTRTLLECCLEARVRHFVFSSTAAVYGTPADGVAAETTSTSPINPYGTSKLMSRVDALERGRRPRRCATWRCAISTSRARIRGVGSVRRPPTRRCSSRSPARRPWASARMCRSSAPTIPTPDGTGVRDYIHVEDLATRTPGCARLPARRGRFHHAQRRLRARLQCAPGARERGARRRAATQRCARSRAARETRRLWSHVPSASARSSAGSRVSTTSIPSSRTSYAWEQRLRREPW